MDWQVNLASELPHEPQTFKVVGASTPDKDLGVVLLELVLGLPDGPDDALERVGHIGEVGDATSYDEDLNADKID